jgi:hypothetical protein
MREDTLTNTEHDAALHEARRGEADDYAFWPTLLEAERDEAEDDCPYWWTDPTAEG